MKPLIVLLGAFGLSLVVTYYFASPDVQLCGRIAMSAMLLFTAVGHFAFTRGMMLMIPPFIPFKKELVLATGGIEIAAAIALLIPSLVEATGWLLIAFFVVLLPANVYAAIHHIDYKEATRNGPGPKYLWFRIPLQLLFIVWVYLCVFARYKG